MSPDREQTADVLADLARRAEKARAAYDHAVEALDDDRLCRALARFEAEHARHARELITCAGRLGGPSARPDVGTRALFAGSRTAVLEALHGVEDGLYRQYQRAIAALDLEALDEAPDILLGHLDDVRRHRQWLLDHGAPSVSAA